MIFSFMLLPVSNGLRWDWHSRGGSPFLLDGFPVIAGVVAAMSHHAHMPASPQSQCQHYDHDRDHDFSFLVLLHRCYSFFAFCMK